jgi:hypothetical protein
MPNVKIEYIGDGKIKVKNGERTTVVDLNECNVTMDDLRRVQLAVYVMCGGGILGLFAAQQPKYFYIDQRVGKLPYRRRDIYNAVELLKAMADVLGLDPNDLPKVETKFFGWLNL